MNETLLNILTVAALLFLLVMWIKSEMDHAETSLELDKADEDINTLTVTMDRFRRDAKEAQDIADHAIEVINEAKYITARTIYESRVIELEKAFVDRRQREAEARELQKQIDEITGGN